MDNIQVTFSTILAFFGAVSVIAGGVKVITQMLSPFKKLSDRIDECERRLEKHDGLFANDKKALDKLQENDKSNTKVIIVLLNHFIDGNGIQKMKELREEIQDRIL